MKRHTGAPALRSIGRQRLYSSKRWPCGDSVSMDDRRALCDSRVPDPPPTQIVDSNSYPDAEGYTTSARAGCFGLYVDNRHRFCNVERKDCRIFLRCSDQQNPNVPAAQRRTLDIAERSVLPKLDHVEPDRQAKQLEQVRKLEAHCGRLEVELYETQVALVQQQVRIMEENVEREDFSGYPCCPVVTCPQDRLILSPRQGLDAAVCCLTSQTSLPVTSSVVCSIPRKRRIPQLSESAIARAHKRRRLS